MRDAKTSSSTGQLGESSEFDELLKRPTAERTDLLRVRMENETIMTEARAHKRNIGDIKQELVVMLEEFPELAEDAIYRRPVGGGKIAVGLSIRAAETLAEAYGYNRVSADVTPIDENTVRVEATFTDFQRCRIWQDAGICTAIYKGNDGAIKRYSDDRWLGLMVKGEAARRVREVILRSVNSALKAWFENECHKVQASLLSDAKVEAIVSKFREREVTVEQLEDFIGKPRAMGWTVADRQNLLGVWTAVKDNETTIAEAFGEQRDPSLPDPTKVVQKLREKQPDNSPATDPPRKPAGSTVKDKGDPQAPRVLAAFAAYEKQIGRAEPADLADIEAAAGEDQSLTDEEFARLRTLIAKQREATSGDTPSGG